MAHYELELRSDFSAAHQLRLSNGELEPLHGHNWQVEVILEGKTLDSTGLLADFTLLHPQLTKITQDLHNSFLNEWPAFASDNPTTERVARYIHDQFSQNLPAGLRIVKVRVWETRNCAAVYVPDDS